MAIISTPPQVSICLPKASNISLLPLASYSLSYMPVAMGDRFHPTSIIVYIKNAAMNLTYFILALHLFSRSRYCRAVP